MHASDGMYHTWANGAAIDHVLYPAAMLDPNHAINGIVWVGSGVVEKISITSQASTTDIIVAIHDLTNSGRPVQLAAAPFYRYAILDAAATGKRPGHGDPNTVPPIAAGTPIFNVAGSATPAAVLASSRRWQQAVAYESAATPFRRTMEFAPNIRCAFGMAVRVTGPNPPASMDTSISITFRPEIIGPMRYARAVQTINRGVGAFPP